MTGFPSPAPFLRDLIRIPSLSGEEAALRERVLQELRDLRFDAAWADGAGNALGLVRGRERGPAWLLLTHLDQVDVGDPALWAHPPFEGVLENGLVHGRGAVDIKGPLSAQVYAVAGLRAAGLRPRRDVVVAAVVDEEVGGSGAEHLVAELPLPVPGGEPVALGACVVGEPSGNRVMLGHRGIARVTASFRGSAHHASLGLADRNPHFALGTFLTRLAGASLPEHPVLGRSTISPTQVAADTRSANLTPNRIELTLDWRTTTESLADMEGLLETLGQGLPVGFELYPPWASGPGGLNTPGFYTEPNHPLARALQRALLEAQPEAPEPGVWRFATDGRHTHRRGIPTVGFGPGDEALAHTTREAIAVSALEFHAAVLGRFLLEAAP